jgi:MFS family permease
MNSKRDKGLTVFMAPLVLGNMLNPLNSTMLATAVLTIVAAFKQEQGAGALLIIPLYFTSAIGQPLMGRLCDVFSPSRINLFGFLLILFSGIVGVSAQSFDWLIISRILLGLGSSAAYPFSITLIKHRYKTRDMAVPGIVLSVIAIAGQVSLVFGPFLGGILLEGFGRKGIFFINIPLVLLGLSFSLIKKNKTDKIEDQPDNRILQVIRDLDINGLLVFSSFLFVFLIALLYPSYLYIKIPLAINLLILLVFIELRHRKPFIDIRVLSFNLLLNTTFLRQIGINFFIYLVLYGLPQWMEQSKHISPSKVGINNAAFLLNSDGTKPAHRKKEKLPIFIDAWCFLYCRSITRYFHIEFRVIGLFYSCHYDYDRGGIGHSDRVQSGYAICRGAGRRSRCVFRSVPNCGIYWRHSGGNCTKAALPNGCNGYRLALARAIIPFSLCTDYAFPGAVISQEKTN